MDAKGMDTVSVYGTIQVCRYNWHSAGSLGWPLSILKYEYYFQIKYKAVLSKQHWKLLQLEITKMTIAV